MSIYRQCVVIVARGALFIQHIRLFRCDYTTLSRSDEATKFTVADLIAIDHVADSPHNHRRHRCRRRRRRRGRKRENLSRLTRLHRRRRGYRIRCSRYRSLYYPGISDRRGDKSAIRARQTARYMVPAIYALSPVNARCIRRVAFSVDQ